MERASLFQEAPRFSSPEEEIAFLRNRLRRHEQEFERSGERSTKQSARELVAQYQVKRPEEVLAPEYQLKAVETAAIVLDLTPEAHDRQIEELIGLMQERGLKNALTVVNQMANPHLEDDFHRFIVQYLKRGLPAKGLKERAPATQVLKMTLFEVALPEITEIEDKTRVLKELLSAMEQFYAGAASAYFTLEIAVASAGREIVFYLGVADDKKTLVEKHLLAIFPKARLVEQKNDYNVFNSDGISVGSVAHLDGHHALPLKTYEQFDYDPLNILINGFSKLDHEGEGGAVQLIFRPGDRPYLKNYKHKLDRLNKGEPAKEVLREENFARDLLSGVGEFFTGGEKKRDDDDKSKKVDQIITEAIIQKISSPIAEVNLRLLASASSRPQAEAVLADLESAFNQFENPAKNKLVFERPRGRRLANLFRNFSFRIFDDQALLPLNLRELTTIFHFPGQSVRVAEQIRQTKAGVAPPPLDLPPSGITLGVNHYRGAEAVVRIGADDRLRHFYTIGQTGTGKSTLLRNMAVQDIKNGDGVCFIDPHGADIIDVLAAVPRERFTDVIYFDPAYTARPMALNMLEYDRRFPEQKTFVVNELLVIFNKLFDMKTVGGPIFEQYFRNAALLALDDPETETATMLDIGRILAEKNFRQFKLSRSRNPVIIQFWREVAEKAGGEATLQNVVPYITSKFDAFLTNDIMRPIIVQNRSSFNLRQIMDERKILLVNLAKGRLGEINANLIGLILVGKILMAALSRVDSLAQNLPPFYLYIDEFQNITTDSTASILSEARKYKLSLNIAHQFIAQLEERVRDAVFGNVGSIAVFRVGADDAEYLEQQFAPVFSKSDLLNLDNRQAYLRLLVNGRPAKPFNIETLPPPQSDPTIIEELKQLSYTKYGQDRAAVEAEVARHYRGNST